MNKTCARCEKTVYPTEELKCLDKVWHKGCFKCQECGMTLNMRTYKGYGKLPYCESHVPKAKHTTMAETPELKRIAENTKLQSNVKYHADFEKSKGKFTQVADDPETLRIKANTKIISNVAYHGDLEKKAHMERQRQMHENGEIVELPSNDNYTQQIENFSTEVLPNPVQNQQKSYYPEQKPQPSQQQPPANRQTPPNQEYYKRDNDYNYGNYPPPPNQYSNPPTQYTPQYNPPTQYSNQYPQTPQTPNQNQYQQYTAPQNNAQNATQNYAPNHGPTQHNAPNPTPNYAPNHASNYQSTQKYDDYQFAYGQYQQGYAGQGPKIGRIQDYDPLSDGPRAPPSTQRATTTLIYNSTSDGRPKGANQPTQQQSRAIGRVTDMDPLAEDVARTQHPANTNQRVYVAMYDYEANDSDEVSFREGDLISNVTSIDSGWMTGQVLRTGHTGMLPANYVEIAPNARN